MRSYGDGVDIGRTSPSCEPHMPVRSPRGSAKSWKTALDKACRAPIIETERPAIAVTAAIWEIPGYTVWLELDGRPNTEGRNGEITDLLDGNRVVAIPGTLEALVGHRGHFSKTYHAKKFFENASNITETLKDKVKQVSKADPA